MKIARQILLGMLLGAAVFGSVLLLTGAVSKDTPNIDALLGSNYPTLNVACSADGSTVYVTAYSRVYRSRNYGADWEIVLSDRRQTTEY